MQKDSHLYVSFLDLKGALNSIDRLKLWKKVAITLAKKVLLQINITYYSDTVSRVRYRIDDAMSSCFPTEIGV